ncbi:hypothetical protein AOL_s00097g576 [Orbilia oligospora ATCC 24927]|uniref:Heat shock 70 kDa protein 12A n=1 Tax=Arthrobotrys oligospora (strain ATCC 24927 / CBS 115.81 / DSM 1491) TaxID=756982 RepID=G1XJP9_ARTOA|nr:hypothetical protein AOL_s00097g576 [Orbilia oligospora ATCC 24927]EGX46672.1 hypothetical protein AOL_s00097g576 [Orbilia oligospora ATCC 24927]
MTRSQQKRKRTEVPPALSPNRERSIVLDAPPTKKARLRQPEIVIGIDWGTTWTGVAWTLVTEKAQNTNEEAKINVIQQWPAGSRTSDKVPTEFVYTEDGSWETLKWGFQAQAPDLSPRVIRWTKLLLDPDYTNLVPEAQEASKKIPHNKAVTELVADYLSALRAHITETLTAVYGPTFLKRSKLKYILTVPAIWSEKAKETHLEAAGKAGYGSKEELDLISEPQAASIAAFRSLGHGPLRRYDCFTVVDCGGGTVDLISYKVMNFRPHIEFREITGGQGGGCGSIFINKAFETYMIKRFGSKNYESMPPKSKARMMGDFELAKQSFSDDEHEEKFYVTAIGLPRKYKGAIGVDGDGYLTLTRDDMRNIFDPTIDSIVALISAQIKSATVASQRVKSGFGGSPYLRRRVQEWVDKEKYTIEVAQPPDAWTSIARGAVMHGIESHTIKDRIARTSYGVCVDVRFNEGIHPKYHVDLSNYHDEYDGILRVRDQMEWFIKKGVRINGIKSVFRVTYCQHLETEEFVDPGDLKITDTLYAYNGDDTPAKPSDYGEIYIHRI